MPLNPQATTPKPDIRPRAQKPIYVGDAAITTDKAFRPRDADDFYETDPNALRAYFGNYPHDLSIGAICDPGAGTGAYGKIIKELYPNAYMVGVEINEERFPPVPGYGIWKYGDYRTLDRGERFIGFDYILGNPPYKHAEAFFWSALSDLRHNTGTIDFLLRLGFLESERRYRTMFTAGYRPTKVTVLSTRPSFTGDGKTYPTAFAFFRWDVVNGQVDQYGEFDFLTFERET